MGIFDKIKNNLFGDLKESKENNESGSKRNFQYLDNLIHSGIKEIVLDSDIVLENNEISSYREGIQLDVDGITIDGNGHTIDAQGFTRIFRVNCKNIVLKNLTFKKGVAMSAAAIYNNESGTLEIENCIFENNVTTQLHGGAIVNDGKISLNNCNFKYNFAQRGGGAINNYCKLNINETTFIGNRALKDGGAINNQPDGQVVINNGVFSENITEMLGGSIVNWGEVTLHNTKFSKNNAKEQGGAINNQTTGKISITDCIFNENSATIGGSMHNWGKITLQNTRFTRNSSINTGGAIYIGSGAILTCNNCEFENNEGVNPGLSIFNESNNSKFFKCIFSNHKLSNVIYNEGNLLFMDCIFRDNDLKFIIFSEVGSSLDLSGGEITNNVLEMCAIYNQSENLTVSNTKFEDNNSKYSEHSLINILNEGELTLQSPKFKHPHPSVLNRKHINIRKMPHSDIEKIIKNDEGSTVDEFNPPIAESNDFSSLNRLIQCSTDSTIELKNDIILENYELDFFEGGIEISKDNIVIDGNNHTINAKSRTRIFNILGKNITIKNVIFKNGFVSNNYDRHMTGGGAVKTIRGSSLLLENCQFVDNVSENDGGAIFNNGILNSLNNKFINNVSKYNGGAILNNHIQHITNDTYHENKAKIAGSIYNNEKLTIHKSIHMLNNTSDFKQDIYNANILNMENIVTESEEILYNTSHINWQVPEWESLSYLTDKLENSNDITLQRDIKLEFNDIDHDLICINTLTLDGNGHVIDLNHLNINFKINGDSTFRNVIFKNAESHKDSLFKILSHAKFENVIFLKNNVTADNNLINNEENGNLELVNSSFYNNSCRHGSLISNNGKLMIDNTDFINNGGQAEGTIINNHLNNTRKVSIEKSNFLSNFSEKNGGTINIQENSIFEVKDSQFLNNHSKLMGGAIYNTAKLILLNCVFIGNTCDKEGGALFNLSYSHLKIAHCNFKDNIAKDNGGAIINWGEIVMNHTDFTGNIAEKNEGGAIHNPKTGKITVISCNFTNNVSQYAGGAISTIKKDAIKLNDCTFNDNSPNDL